MSSKKTKLPNQTPQHVHFSNASTGGLSRSAEQLCERLAEAAESSKIRGCSTLTRKSHKGGGTWGSISRVFARQKKRAALDASLYDGKERKDQYWWGYTLITISAYSVKISLFTTDHFLCTDAICLWSVGIFKYVKSIFTVIPSFLLLNCRHIKLRGPPVHSEPCWCQASLDNIAPY